MMNKVDKITMNRQIEMVFVHKMFIAAVAMVLTLGLLISNSLAATVTLADGPTADPASFSADQGSTGNIIDYFQFTRGGGGQKGITEITVTTGGTGGAFDIQTVRIVTADGVTTFGSSSTPAGEVWTIAGTAQAAVEMRIEIDLKSGATVGNTVTAQVTGFVTNGTNGGGSDAATTVITVSQAPQPDSLSVAVNSQIAVSPVTEGDQNIQMQRLQVDCTDGLGDDGNCIITSVVVEDIGTDNTGAIANLEVHIDTDSTFPGNENVQDATFNGTQKTIDLTSLSSGLRTVAAGTSKYIWIVYDLNGSTAGKDVTSRVTAVNVDTGTADSGASGIWDSNNLAINASIGPDSLSVTSNNPIATTASQGVTDVQMQWIRVDCTDGLGDDGNCNINSVTVDDTQTSTTGKIDLLQVHFDDNTNFGDGTLGSNSVSNWNGEAVIVDMSAVNGKTVAAGTPLYIWILYDINASAPLENVEASVTAITVAGPDSSPSGGPWNSNLFAITAPVPDTLSVTANTAVATTATGGDQNVRMQWLQVDCSAGGGDDGICDITSLTVDDLQTSATGKIDRVEVHMDDDSDYANGTLGSNNTSSWDGQFTVVDMSGVTGNAVTAGISKFIWIIYDLNGLASGNVNSSVTAIAVNGPDNAPAGGPWNSNNFTVLEMNQPPSDPASMDQYKLDGSTAISAGGTTTEKAVLIKATVTDNDSTPDTVRLEVEMADGAFTGTPNCASTYVTSGTVATAVCENLDPTVQYNWKARVYDGEDFNAGGWIESMAGNPDVIISNTAPNAPTDHDQYKMDGTTQISQDGLTAQNTVKIKATLNDPDQDDLKLEVEIVDYNGGAGSFNDIPNCSSDVVSDGSVATATCINLLDATDYMWQARTNDGNTVSAWQGFGAARDVTVAISQVSNKLIHNSSNLNSPKWAAEGGWNIGGKCSDPIYMTQIECERNSATWTPGGKYGEVVCDTCHTSDTPNIKRVRVNIYAPNGIDQYPGEAGGQNIVLTDQRDGTADFGDDTGGHATSNKICEYCHSKLKYHNYDTSVPEQVTLLHNNNKDCNICHQHKNGFAGGGECVLCHDGVPLPNTYITRDITDPAAGDFYVYSSRHVFGGTTVTNWDCIVCHMEGDAAAAEIGEVVMTLKHNNKDSIYTAGGIAVDLRDVDNPSQSWQWDKYDGTCSGGSGGDDVNECVDGGGTWTWNSDQMLTDMDEFCMKCHDSDASRGAGLGGASGIAVNNTTNNDGAVTLSPSVDERLKPFNSTDGVDAGTGGGTVSLAGYERTAVVDAYGQFDPANPSHHAVRGQAYTSHNASWGDSAWVDKTLKNGTKLIDGGLGVYEAASMHCADCHTVDYNSHGASNGFMLEADSIDGECYLCHSINVYDNVSSTDTRWDHSEDGSAWASGKGAKIGLYGGNSDGSFCRNCHGGNIGDYGSFVDGYGGIHGLPSGADSRSGEERYRFIGGDYMSHAPSSWTDTSGSNTPTCYFRPAGRTQDWSNCTQHEGTDSKRTSDPAYARGVPGQY